MSNVYLPELTYPERSNKRKLTHEVSHVSGTLTCGLGRWREGRRSLLLVNEGSLELDAETRKKFERFRNDIAADLRSQTHREKQLVNRLLSSEVNPPELENVGVAVHKFGPVPVFLLPKQYTYTTRWDGKIIDVRIGIHADPALGGGQLSLGLFRTDGELIESVRREFPMIMERYLDDVGEVFHDIENHATLQDAFRLGKVAEEIIGESIQSKLRILIPRLEAAEKKGMPKNKILDEWAQYTDPRLRMGMSRDRRLACEVYRDQAPAMIRVQYARLAALYAVNELYALLGLTSRAVEYSSRVRELRETVRNRHGEGAYDAALQDGLLPLREALRCYAQHDARIVAISVGEDEPRWLRCFVRFLQFLHYLREWGDVSPSRPRFFISYNHAVASSETLRTQICDWLVKDDPARRVHAFSIDGHLLPDPFREHIKAGIWLSDALICIVPKDVTRLGEDGENKPAPSGKQSHYQWLAREAEHALLLGKRIWYFVEDGSDIEKLRGALCPRPVDDPSTGPGAEGLRRQDELLNPLAPEARVVPGRAQRLLDQFNRYVFTQFSVARLGGTRQDLPAPVAHALPQMRDLARDDRHRGLLNGWFNQFSDRTRLILAAIQLVARKADAKIARKKEIKAFLLKEYPEQFLKPEATNDAISAAWEQAKGRRLNTTGGADDTGSRLVEMVSNGCYRGALDDILRSLRPEMGEPEFERWRATVIRYLEQTHY